MNERQAKHALANELTLSVVSHGHGEMLHRLMEDLERCPDLYKARIIVTLNKSGEAFDSTRFASLDILVLRNAEPQGFGKNHNAAFAHCNTAWFAILNPDIRLPEATCLDTLMAEAVAIADLGLTAPEIRNSAGALEDAARENLSFSSLLSRVVLRRDKRPDTTVAAVRGSRFYWLAGMFLVMRSDVFRSIRGFDERFFLYCEDYDLCARLFNAGYRLVRTSSTYVVHDAQRASHRSVRHLLWHVASLLKVWTSKPFWRVWLSDLKAAN